LGRFPKLRVSYLEESAEVIVLKGNDLRQYLRRSHK